MMDSINELHYLNIFPNVRLGYRFSDDKEIGINYSYRLWRPWSNQLNPFIQKNSDYSYSTGNPALEPSYTHNVSLSYSSNFVFFPTVSYSHSYNNRETLTIPMDSSYGIEYNELALMSYPINLGTSDRVSAHLSYNKSIGRNWHIGLNGGVDYSHVESTNKKVNASNDGVTYNVSANAFGTLPYNIRLSFFFMYHSANINAFGRSTGWQNFDISLNKDFFDKKLNVGVSCNFRNFQIWHTESEYLNHKSESWGRRELPYWRFSIRYKFGKFYQNKQVRKQKLENFDSEDNQQSQEGGLQE